MQQKNVDVKEKLVKYNAVIINRYLTTLNKQLVDKNSMQFWIIPNGNTFIKIKGVTLANMQTLLISDTAKYANTKICHFIIMPQPELVNDNLNKPENALLTVKMIVYHVTNGIINETNAIIYCNYMWRMQDFSITKFSFKLLQKIMNVVIAGNYLVNTIEIVPLQQILANLKEQNIDTSQVCSPLAGLIKIEL